MSTEIKREPALPEFCNALLLACTLEAKLKKCPVDVDFVNKIKSWASGLFRLVVMGEVKKGKSSFINALLGTPDLVPVSSDVATSTIYKICYGENLKYKVFFTRESGKSCVEIDQSNLAQYGTEAGNPDNEKQVDFIQVFVPSPLLRNGLVIIDTPGLGGLFKDHKQVTYQYVPKANAVFMVSDSVESPIGQAELDALKDLKSITDQVYFVQTKAMAVCSEERKSREKNNRNTLITHGGIEESKLRYFVVDSHLKHDADEAQDKEDLVDSGFPAVTAFINNVIAPGIHKSIMKNALKAAKPKLDGIESVIKQNDTICNANTQEKRDEITRILAEADNDLKSWQANLPMLQDKFQDGIREIKEHAQNCLKECRPQGALQAEYEKHINKAESITVLSNIIDSIQQNLPGTLAQYRYKALLNVQQELDILMNNLGDYNIKLNSSNRTDMQIADNTLANTQALANIINPNDDISAKMFDNARTAIYGGTAGVTIAVVAGGIIGSIVPAIGTIIGSEVGLLLATGFGGYKAVNIKNNAELKSAKEKTIARLGQSISVSYQELIENVQKYLGNVDREMTRALRSALTERQNELLTQKEELKKRESQSHNVFIEEKKQIEAFKKEFAVIKKTIDAVKA